jgi:C4-type Zn-finger protein
VAVATKLGRRIVKTFKCPLCGGTFELYSDLTSYDVHEEIYEQVHRYVCDTCALTSDWAFIEEEAERNLEKLLNRFSPLMRVRKPEPK